MPRYIASLTSSGARDIAADAVDAMAAQAYTGIGARNAIREVLDACATVQSKVAMLRRRAMGIATAWGANGCIAKAALAIVAGLAGLHVGAIVAIRAAAIDVRFLSILDAIRARGRNARVRPARGIANESGHCTIRIDVALDALSCFGSGRIGTHRTAILRTRSGNGRGTLLTAAACLRGAIIEVIRRVVVVHDLGIAGAIANLKFAVTDELAGVRWRAVRDRRRAANAHIAGGDQARIHGVWALRWIGT